MKTWMTRLLGERVLVVVVHAKEKVFTFPWHAQVSSPIGEVWRGRVTWRGSQVTSEIHAGDIIQFVVSTDCGKIVVDNTEQFLVACKDILCVEAQGNDP